MDKRVVLGCLVAMSIGCGGGGTSTPDMGVTPMDDMGTMPAADMGPPALMVASPATLDLSCRGTATAPMGGAATSATITATEYVAMTPLHMTTIDVWTNDMIGTGACAAPDCVSGMTDSMGVMTTMAPVNGWVALHIHSSADTAETLAYNLVWPSDNLPTAGFSSSSISLVSSLLGRTFQTMTAGAISGQVNDCMDHHIANAEARVFHGTTQVVTGPSSDRTSPRINGLQGTNPTRSGLTGDGGTFVGANVPVGDDYHVEIWGSPSAGAASELIGCEEGRVVAGAITVLVIGPLRSDYAAGSACAMAAAAH